MYQQINLHDGLLTEISIREKDVLLKVKQVDGTLCRIVLNDVLVFKADDFLMGNIILDIRFFTLNEVNQSELTQLMGSLYDDGIVNDVIIKQSTSEKRVYFELNPSYGCQITSICSSINIDPIPEGNI